MVTYPSNALNISGGAGLIQFDGTATFSEVSTSNNGVLISSNSGVISWLANSGTAGFVLTANTGAPPSWQAAASGGGLTWTDKNANFNAVKTNGYFCFAALTATLPGSPSEGDTISFICTTTAIVIRANTGQTITLSSTSSTSAGTATNVASGDSITLVYRATGTTWWANNSVGNWTMA